MNDFKTLTFNNNELIFIDQTKLPLYEEYIHTDNYNRIAEAIEKLEIRGAPAIGVAAAYALALSVKKNVNDKKFTDAYNRLFSTRPTAYNLFYALNRIKEKYSSQKNNDNVYRVLVNEATQIHDEDIIKCLKIAENGLAVFKKPSTVLTHCNAGKLATGGNGTAVNVITEGFRNGLVNMVYVDETRPLLQGSRLTAFELNKAGIPFKIITDSTAAFLMQHKKVDLVITGADRIAANGDAANKIGTYSLAVICSYHQIPFYIAAPVTTIDNSCKSGEDIIIEERNKNEILSIKNIPIAPAHYEVYAPAFDVTPAKLISAIITDKAFVSPPFNF